jgi:hypothetical protein
MIAYLVVMLYVAGVWTLFGVMEVLLPWIR